MYKKKWIIYRDKILFVTILKHFLPQIVSF